MAELLQLPRLLDLHAGGRKVWRDSAPRGLIEENLPIIKAQSIKLKARLEVAKAHLAAMPNKTSYEKKVFEAHEVKLKQLKNDVAEFEALPSKLPAAPKAKAKK